MWVEFGQEDEGSGVTPRAARDVDTGELQHELASGFLFSGREFGSEAEEFAGFLEELFFAV